MTRVDADSDADAVPSVSARDLLARLDAGEPVAIIDTRNRDEIDAWRIEHPAVTHYHLPYAKVLAAKVSGGVASLLEFDQLDGRIVAVCPRGEASREVAGVLREAGIDAANLEGGMEAWANLYTRTEVADGLYQYRRPSSGCLSYLVVSNDAAAVVDPLRAFVDRYVEDAADFGVELVAAIDTHVHADHLSGRSDLAARGATGWLPESATDRGASDDVTTYRDEVRVGGRTLRAVALPGHTTEMTGLALDGVLLTGDSLFLDAVARPDLQGGDVTVEQLARELYATLHDRLADVPDEPLVLPCPHGPGTEPREDGAFAADLGTLRSELVAFEESEASFLARVTGDTSPPPANHERIVDINLGRETMDDETALDLELGPNNCALTGD
jgi:glyoxylase-like metal-dependent hydrolase (beta-lactamase superfamily II)